MTTATSVPPRPSRDTVLYKDDMAIVTLLFRGDGVFDVSIEHIDDGDIFGVVVPPLAHFREAMTVALEHLAAGEGHA